MKNWKQEVEKRQDELIQSTCEFLKIPSVYESASVTTEAPFGEGIAKAYNWLLDKAEKEGFRIKDLSGKAGHIEWGQGDEIIGVLCHIDVVPGGEGWTTPAFSADIRDDHIYARGALDDKGPTMASYYALKLIKELNIPLNKRIRLIIGTDEEREWQCVKHYFKYETMPDIGFVPDADFPVICAEKGIADFLFYKKAIKSDGLVMSFSAGTRFNMVPDKAVVTLNGKRIKDLDLLKQMFTVFLSEEGLTGKWEMDEALVVLTFNGLAAHGSTPEEGRNAALAGAAFLTKISLKEEEKTFFQFLNQLFYDDYLGERLGISYTDDELGAVTINIGTLSYERDKGIRVGINLRYPSGADYQTIMGNLIKAFDTIDMDTEVVSHQEPHGVRKDHPLIKVLSDVYKRHTGESREPIAIGGGTYARALRAGVAFGPLFPGQPDVIHQPDEYITIDHLIKLTSIYADAMSILASNELKE
ncbi:dipeptidase PepV [Salipaludibacillus agaradhaerens]|uniref:dipeptidase PepV n=1 Tax=Salipaludibacillus agaradhaerens TaxID=76935 RepID=UPI002151E637|nr:dipeptidase PepV [Salipaludibacillus agaradhaerens]MCR6119680.1 dipeptidase PepV [Salipaludibacillus agaradhaerens]